jgi:REP element-mobilizing transposase RayT
MEANMNQTGERQPRKNLRLPDYDYSQNGMYFVTICTEKRRNILGSIVGDGFSVPAQSLTGIGLIADGQIGLIPLKYKNVSIPKYVIMPNHIHLILSIDNTAGNPGSGAENPPPTLGTVVAWYKYQTMKLINPKSQKVTTKIWQRSYYDHIIRHDQDYLAIWQYIDDNPAKWAEDDYYSRD